MTTAQDTLDRTHRFIEYITAKPRTADASRLATYILNHYLTPPARDSATQWRKRDRLQLQWSRPNEPEQHQAEFRFDDLVEHIQETRSFDPSRFGLPDLECDWLDHSFAIAKPDAPVGFIKLALGLPFGPDFPLTPCIDREGAAYASFQQPIQQGIVRLHKTLVEQSQRATSLDGLWLNDLRMLLNECISIVDITLHQLYFMAQYRGAELGWRFDPQTLGERHGKRLNDKLNWIARITGRALDDANEERPAFERIKHVRNHFSHFDPPCIAYNVEDLVQWLNDVPMIGRFLWKIRDKLGAQLSRGIVEIVTLPPVQFVPRNPSLPRIPLPDDAGYASTIWPTLPAG